MKPVRPNSKTKASRNGQGSLLYKKSSKKVTRTNVTDDFSDEMSDVEEHNTAYNPNINMHMGQKGKATATRESGDMKTLNSLQTF